jgi:arylsulfatase A-like enzyme
MTPAQDIVFLVLDSVRHDAIGSDGDGFADVPFLEDTSSDSMSFQRAYAPAPWTVPSHASMFTGAYPTEHETSHGGKKYLNPEYPTLAEHLQNSGYYTELYTNNVHLVPEFGFTRGFDDITRGPLVSNDGDLIDWNEFIANREHDSGLAKYVEIFRHALENRHKKLIESLRAGLTMKAQHHRGDSGAQATVNHFESKETPDKPTFTFINLMEAHNPFRPPEAFREHEPLDVDGWQYELGEQSLSETELDILKSLYRGEIEYLDGMVRRLYELLADDDTVFIFTSDHGVSLGEHGKLYHGSCLYESTIHVPLIIDGIDRSDNIEEPVGIVSLYRTLLEMVGIEVPPHARGGNILETTDDCVLAEMHGTDDWLERHAQEHHGKEMARMVSATRRALVSSDEKLIRNEDTGETELYDVTEDPGEQRPIADNERIDAMEQTLEGIIGDFKLQKNSGEQEDLDREMEQKLQDLGYLK